MIAIFRDGKGHDRTGVYGETWNGCERKYLYACIRPTNGNHIIANLELGKGYMDLQQKIWMRKSWHVRMRITSSS